MKWFKNKRQEIAKTLPKNSVLVLASLPEYFRQTDVPYPYRQESHFYYLTGFQQANSLFVLFPSGKSLLFIPDKNPVKEVWEGPLYGIKPAQKKFLINKVYPLSELDTRLMALLKKPSLIYYHNINPFFDKKIKALKKHVKPAEDFLKPFRRIKDKTEIASINKAIHASIYAHKQVAKNLKPGINERALHGIFIKSIMEKSSPREAYGGIFACGTNALVLHYSKNNAVCKKGDLLLVDAGAEINYYSADITRVYPVSGRFSPSQKTIYNKLLSLQKQLIKEVAPGKDLKAIDKKMKQGLTQILLSLGWIKGSLKDGIKKQLYKKYCPHSVGHLLGIDVHDVTFLKKEQSLLKPGMVLTIEPGFYIPTTDKQAPKNLRGVGLRIEDDILVTNTGQKNLTKNIPKEIEEIEELCSA